MVFLLVIHKRGVTRFLRLVHALYQPCISNSPGATRRIHSRQRGVLHMDALIGARVDVGDEGLTILPNRATRASFGPDPLKRVCLEPPRTRRGGTRVTDLTAAGGARARRRQVQATITGHLPGV